jgi:bacterioferritin-associated ferredoxin
MYVCICNAVTERTIEKLVADGCSSLAELQSRTGCADCCGTCHDYAVEVLDRALIASSRSPVVLPSIPLVA